MRRAITAGLAPLALAAAPAAAQQSVSDTNKYCWAENIGYLNWRDAGGRSGYASARLHATFLSGFVWGENTGWINLGDGTPANGVAYANTDGADSGVNLDPATGLLSGLAWGENIGWINFAGAPTPASISPAPPRRLHGYAWGENVGWINLDDAAVFVEFAAACPADWDGDDLVNSGDVSAFLTAWIQGVQGGDLAADFNADGAVNSADISAFLAAWLAAVQGGCG